MSLQETLAIYWWGSSPPVIPQNFARCKKQQEQNTHKSKRFSASSNRSEHLAFTSTPEVGCRRPEGEGAAVTVTRGHSRSRVQGWVAVLQHGGHCAAAGRRSGGWCRRTGAGTSRTWSPSGIRTEAIRGRMDMDEWAEERIRKPRRRAKCYLAVIPPPELRPPAAATAAADGRNPCRG